MVVVNGVTPAPLRQCATCLRKLGLSHKRIAKHLRRSKSTVENWLSKPPKPAGVKSSKRPCAVCLWKLGYGYDRIARRLHAKRKNVARWLKGEGCGGERNQNCYLRLRKSIPKKPRQRKLYKRKPYTPRPLRPCTGKSQAQVRKKMRLKLWWFVKHGKRRRRMEALVGCTRAQLLHWFYRRLPNGMTIRDYGPDGWVIDHVWPCKYFDLTNVDEQKACFHYSNLQPLTWHQNATKSAKLENF